MSEEKKGGREGRKEKKGRSKKVEHVWDCKQIISLMRSYTFMTDEKSKGKIKKK